MNRLMQWMMAAILICGTTVFTSCNNDDNPVNPADNLAEKILGKWIVDDFNGQLLPTNEKVVYTFVSATKATISTAYNSHPEISTFWNSQLETDVVISGNKVTLTNHPDEHLKAVEEFTVSAINETEFIANHKITITIDGKIVLSNEGHSRYTRVTRDYSEAILGTWEGHVTSEQDTYGDGLLHRWEYKADGTYLYYIQNEDGEWVPSPNTLNEYFVDGTLLCSRWINDEIEYREWWEIASIKNGVMKWKALRQNEDGTTYTATFEMTEVEE